MDVSSMARVSQGFAQYATQAKNTANKSATQNSAAQAQLSTLGSAYDLDISPEAKQAAQQATNLQEDLSVDEDSAQKTKGLSADQISELKADLETQEQTMLNIMIQALTESNDKLQGWLDDGVGILNFGAEDAKKAISEGGAWSVDAVSTRIFDLATAIAGNDPEKLSQMRAAVEEGFRQAGLTWKNATGQNELPEISKQTYTEIMSRFDKRANELSGATLE